MTNPRQRNDPKPPEEWQEAVDAAAFCLTLDSARQYGLVEGGPTLNVERCAHILAKGETLGYMPGTIEELTRRFVK